VCRQTCFQDWCAASSKKVENHWSRDIAHPHLIRSEQEKEKNTFCLKDKYSRVFFKTVKMSETPCIIEIKNSLPIKGDLKNRVGAGVHGWWWLMYKIREQDEDDLSSLTGSRYTLNFL
jgi:hypothetical protein